MKTNTLNRIKDKLSELDETSYRYQVLDTCKRFKTTWIELGQALYSTHRDKLYLEWDYVNFEKYCNQELGIKKPTALKLLKSYRFLEKEEPTYIKKTQEEATPESKYPDLEAVNLLRLAHKKKDMDEKDYLRIRDQVLDESKESSDVRKELKMLSDRDPQKNPDEIRADRRGKYLKKLYTSLENAKLEAMANRFLPPNLIDQLDEVSQKVERELNRD